MSILRRQSKQGAASDWIKPAEMEPGPPGSAGPPGSSWPQASLGPPAAGTQPVQVRLRPVTAGGSDWLRGALHMSPGSLLWQPDSGVSAQPVELAAATMLPAEDWGKRRASMLVELETPAGRFQLDMDPMLFEMSQELVAEAAAREGSPGDV